MNLRSHLVALLALTTLALGPSACKDKSYVDAKPPAPTSLQSSASKTSADPVGVAPTAGAATSPAVARKEPDPRVFHRSLGEPEFLDPGLCSESEGGTVINDTFEGLFVYGPTHKEVRPGVATSMEISPDGRVYTFKLRPDAKWSDGTPITARDFEWSWKRVLDPKTASRYTDIMAPIEGALELAHSDEKADREALKAKVGVRAVDDLTLEVKLKAATSYFKDLTAFYTFSPVPRHIVEKYADQWARPENIQTNGPWKISEWKSKQHIIALKNEHYWDKGNLPFDKLVYHISETNEPQHNMYLAGEMDFLDSRVPESDLPRYIKEKNPEHRENPYLGIYYYMFNVKKPPFDNVKVRRALNMAIDKPQIGKFVAKGNQIAATSIVPFHLKDIGYTAPEGPKFDPSMAKTLLAEAGYPDGQGFPRFQISYNTLEGHKLIAEFFQQQWKKNLSIDCDLNNMEWKVLLKKQHEKDFQVTRTAWIGDYVDPMTFLDLFESKNPNNRTQWENPSFDALIKAAGLETDPPKRFGLLRQAEQLFIDEMPSIPIYNYVKHDLVRPWVSGYTEHLQGIHLAKYFRIQP